MSDRKYNTKEEKSQRIYTLYSFAYEKFNKNINKKESNMQLIKEMNSTLKSSPKILDNPEQFEKYSLLLVEPVEKCTTKIIEIILSIMEEILKYDLVPPHLMQRMVEKLIVYIHKYFQYNEIDFKVDSKILEICELIYSNQNIFIHNENLKYIIKIYLRIFLSSHNTENLQSQTKTRLFILIDKMVKRLTLCNIMDKNVDEIDSIQNIQIQKGDLETQKAILYKLQLNEFNFITKKYTDFLIDLIEIQSEINEKEKSEKKSNLINNYINIIQKASYNQRSDLIKSELESLKLDELNLEYTDKKNKKSYKIGKYGWCILCRKTANYWSKDLQFPVCCGQNGILNNNINTGINCDIEFQKCLYNLYPRSDFLNMLIYLSTTSTLGSADEETTKTNSEVRILCRQFCLINVKEMLEKSNNYFQNDNDIIYIVRELFKDSLLKNALSNKIKIFQLSLEVFVSLIKHFRVHLKEQIEIFMTKVLIKILESEIFDYEYKKAILDVLMVLVEDAEFIVEIYVNYDCDVNSNAVFSILINLLTKIINGLYKKSKYQSTFKNQEENLLVSTTLSFFNKFVENLNKLVEKNEQKKNRIYNNNIQEENENAININTTINNTTTLITNINSNEISNADENSANNLIDVKDKIAKNLQLKKYLEKAIEVFNIGKSSSGFLNYLEKEKMIYSEQSFSKIKSTYIDDINNNTIQNDYSKLLSPEEFTIINDVSSEEVSLEVYKNTNIMKNPFLSTINPLVYFIVTEDKEKLPTLNYEDYKAFEVARFIRTNLKKLIRERVGDYLCSGKDFNKKALTYFINSFDFANQSLLEAMRVLFYELPLAGEAQVIDRVVQTFGEKFHKQNPNELKNPDFCYYLPFAILQLNTDLHRSEVEKKMTLKEFIDQLNIGNERIDPKYLENIYNTIAIDPLVIPGQKLSGSNKNKKELIQEEKKNIMESTFYQLNTLTNISSNYNYVMGADNDAIRNLLESSWSNFFSTYSILLAETTDGDIIKYIFLMARTCGILKLNTAVEAYINAIIGITNINDNREIKNAELIENLITFIRVNGQYIRTGWNIILETISKIDYYLNTDKESIKEDLKHKPSMKNIEKEISINLQKKDILSKHITDMIYDGIFSKTNTFDEETIINFVTCLCAISKSELTEYYHKRVFSLVKLSEVADFNIFRIQVQWVKIWKLIGEHFVYVITHIVEQNIWQNALDNLKQIIGKLLLKKDLSIYNFQMDFFKPFIIIFKQTKGIPERGQFLINYIYFIVGQYGQNIHSGWIVIFNILKEALQRNDPKMNELVLQTLQKISEESFMINNANIEVFRGYIETLCYMYLDKSLKQYSFEMILNLLAKIMKEMDSINEEKDKEKSKEKVPVLKLPGVNKKYDFLQIFFYGFDDLIHINVIEHLNLLFEIISHNKKLIFTSDCHSFLYMYYSYFKPHLVILLLSRYINRFNLFENIPNLEQFQKYNEANTLEAKTENIRLNLIDSLSALINDFSDEKGVEYDKIFYDEEKKKENKTALIGFLREIKEGYNKNDMTLIIKKKLTELTNIEERNYEFAIDVFLEKFKNMFSSLDKNEQYLKYNYFYEDLFLTIHKLLIINHNSDLLIKILNKVLTTDDNIDSNKKGTISEKSIEKINEGNLFILNLISNAKIKTNEEKLHKLVGFSSSYCNFVLSFIQHYESDINSEFKLLSKIFSKFLQIELENVFDRYKIVSSSSTVDMLIRFQGIQLTILDQIKNEEYDQLYSDETSIRKLIYLNQIYNKYNLSNQENKPMINILIFELENIMPKFMKCLSEDELKQIFEVLINLIDSNDSNLRKATKNLLNEYTKLNIITFNKYK